MDNLKKQIKNNKPFIYCQLAILVFCIITLLFNAELEQFQLASKDALILFYFAVLNNNSSLYAFGPLLCYIAISNHGKNSVRMWSVLKAGLLIPLTTGIILLFCLLAGLQANTIQVEMFQGIWMSLPKTISFFMIHSFVIGCIYAALGLEIEELLESRFLPYILIIMVYHLSQFMPRIGEGIVILPSTTLNIITIHRTIISYGAELLFAIFIWLIAFVSRCIKTKLRRI